MITHLHVHTEYSLLDGASRIADLVSRAKELGMKSLAITDHGVMYGVIDFYKECKKQGIKPIIGCEVYFAPRSRFSKEAGKDSQQNHMTLLAKDMTGYKNLIYLVSKGSIEGFYYKPRIDNEIIKDNCEGIIALSGCLSGAIPKALLNGDSQKAKELALFYNETFGQGNFYLEIQGQQTREQITINNELIKMGKELDIPVVATNDVHYVKKEDAKYQDILICIQTGKTVNDEDRLKFDTEDFYLKSYEEMRALLPQEAIENSNVIAEMCNVEFEFGKVQLPKFDVPSQYTSFEYLKKLCFDGLDRRYGKNIEAEERLKYELQMIESMGFVDYFLIVWDYMRFCYENDIIVGPGRGSAAGSIVSYVLNITNLDPLKYNLVFERFLNPERITMPDIDIDFCYERRQEVIDYVVKKYGSDRVAQIVTFGTMAARGAIRDVGRALDMSYQEVDFIAKKIPFEVHMTISKALDINPELKKLYEEEVKVKELIDTAMALEGLPRHSSTHAAGVVICEKPITEIVPVQRNDESIITQFPFTTLEELGILKMDFLGLRTLTVIRDTVKLIKEGHGKEINIYNIDFEDKSVYKSLTEGNTIGVFQLESVGFRQLLKELRPGCIEDIIAAVALFRPGPMEQIPTYIKNKNHPQNVEYLHPALEGILNVTYGCMVYQEQVLQIVRELAGYSLGRADLVRRAMGKKKMDVMIEERKNFIHGIVDKNGEILVEGAIRRGIDEEAANKIFDQMLDFASYAFNKAHSACYAVIAYQTAWLKYHYPQEFMTSLLNSVMSNGDKITYYIQECKRMGISVSPPDINRSKEIFTVDNGSIRFGLAALKNVGVNAILSIVEKREKEGKFESFEDFCYKINTREVNKRCVESLIKCGAFDHMGLYRSRIMAVYEKILDGIGESKKKNYDGQFSLFDIAETQNDDIIKYQFPQIDEYPVNTLLTMEKEVAGLYLCGHPLSQYEKELRDTVTAVTSDLAPNDLVEGDIINNILFGDNDYVTLGGIITSKKVKYTKNNKIMAFITLEDLHGSIEVIIFPTILEKYNQLIEQDNIVFISGRLSIKEEEAPKILCDKVIPIEKGQTSIKKLYIKVLNNESEIDSIVPILKQYSGDTPVYVYNESTKQIKIASRSMWTNINEELLSQLRNKLGEKNVKIT